MMTDDEKNTLGLMIKQQTRALSALLATVEHANDNNNYSLVMSELNEIARKASRFSELLNATIEVWFAPDCEEGVLRKFYKLRKGAPDKLRQMTGK